MINKWNDWSNQLALNIVLIDESARLYILMQYWKRLRLICMLTDWSMLDWWYWFDSLFNRLYANERWIQSLSPINQSFLHRHRCVFLSNVWTVTHLWTTLKVLVHNMLVHMIVYEHWSWSETYTSRPWSILYAVGLSVTQINHTEQNLMRAISSPNRGESDVLHAYSDHHLMIMWHKVVQPDKRFLSQQLIIQDQISNRCHNSSNINITIAITNISFPPYSPDAVASIQDQQDSTLYDMSVMSPVTARMIHGPMQSCEWNCWCSLRHPKSS